MNYRKRNGRYVRCRNDVIICIVFRSKDSVDAVRKKLVLVHARRTRSWKVMENTPRKVVESPAKPAEVFCMNPVNISAPLRILGDMSPSSGSTPAQKLYKVGEIGVLHFCDRECR